MSNSAPLASRGLKWALLPLYFGPLFTGAKSFEANPLVGSARLNALGLHKARAAVAYRRAEARRARLARLVSAEDRAGFERDGFVIRRNFLADADFARLVDELRRHRGSVQERGWGETVN